MLPFVVGDRKNCTRAGKDCSIIERERKIPDSSITTQIIWKTWLPWMTAKPWLLLVVPLDLVDAAIVPLALGTASMLVRGWMLEMFQIEMWSERDKAISTLTRKHKSVEIFCILNVLKLPRQPHRSWRATFELSFAIIDIRMICQAGHRHHCCQSIPNLR